MKKQQLRTAALAATLSLGLSAGFVQADQTLNGILKEGHTIAAAGTKSQQRIDRLQDETSDLYQQFKVVNKEIEGLRVYNEQLQKQINNQLVVITQLTESIDGVTVLERQVQPLVLRMLDALEQFVDLDVPFLQEERKARIAKLFEVQDRADVSVSEKFRQVLEAYRIESEYGRNILTYEDSLNIGGVDLQVNMLMLGRIALVYQTKDRTLTGVWDSRGKAWVELDPGTYATSISQGIRIAKQEAPIDIIRLPISSPEAAQ